MRRCVIIGGAEISDYSRIRTYLNNDDYCVFCDSGLYHSEGLGVQPDLIVGDFDSHPQPQPQRSAETIVLPREKDDTDTVFAVKEALRRGFDEFLLIGAVGGRLDHSLGNVSLLLMLDTKGVPARLVDDYSEMQIVSREAVQVADRYSYFSLLNISGTAEGIMVTGAKYPLSNASIDCEYQYGISNEVLPGRTAEVTVQNGRLLLVKVF